MSPGADGTTPWCPLIYSSQGTTDLRDFLLKNIAHYASLRYGAISADYQQGTLGHDANKNASAGTMFIPGQQGLEVGIPSGTRSAGSLSAGYGV